MALKPSLGQTGEVSNSLTKMVFYLHSVVTISGQNEREYPDFMLTIV